MSSRLYWIIKESLKIALLEITAPNFSCFATFFAVAFPNLTIYIFLEKTNIDSSSLYIELKSNIHFTFDLCLLSSDDIFHSQLLCQPQSSQQLVLPELAKEILLSWVRTFYKNEIEYVWSSNRAEQSEYAIYIFFTSVNVLVHFFRIPSKIEM